MIDPDDDITEEDGLTRAPLPRADRRRLVDPQAWRRAQEAQAVGLAGAALTVGHLDAVLASMSAGDRRGALHGTELLKVLAAPGDILADPVATISRCLRAGFAQDQALGEAAEEWPDLDALARPPGRGFRRPRRRHRCWRSFGPDGCCCPRWR